MSSVRVRPSLIFLSMKTIICPDTHGKDFYKPLLENKEDSIVFLGDLTDPYYDVDYHTMMERAYEILNFVDQNQERVKILLSNHDMYYFFQRVGNARYNHIHHQEIEQMFDEYKDLFKIAHYENNCLFTHAGVNPYWLEDCRNRHLITWEEFDNIDQNDPQQIANWINNHCTYDDLKIIGFGRGGWGIGSCLWADIDEHYTNDLRYNQIVGHTAQKVTGSIKRHHNIACVDSRAIFEYDGKTLKLYNNVNSEQ